MARAGTGYLVDDRSQRATLQRREFVYRVRAPPVYEHAVRHLVAVAAVLACTNKEPSKQPPPTRPVVHDAAASAARDSNVAPCVVRINLSADRITLGGGGISGGDVTALSKVAKTCTTLLVADDAVTFEEVMRTVRLVVEQGIDELRLGEPVGQWMSMDLDRVMTLWNVEPAAKLVAAVKEEGPRLGADHASLVDQVSAAIARGRQNEPIGKQTADRGIFEAIAQIVGLRRATAPVAVDLLERAVMPALQIDATAPVLPSSLGDMSKPQTGVELFEMFLARAGVPW